MNKATLLFCSVVGVVLATQIPSLLADDGQSWNVVVASQAIVTHKGAAATESLSAGSIVSAGDILTTQASGAVVLARGEDLITMAENSEISITDPQPASTTLIAQPYGDVGYTVTKQSKPHFEVTTPLLAAVVKGTSFTVHADESGSSVTVSDGKVEVRDEQTGKSAQVEKGHVGTVKSGAPNEIEVREANAAPRAPETSAAISAEGEATDVSGAGNSSGSAASGSSGASDADSDSDGDSDSDSDSDSDGEGDGKGKGKGKDKEDSDED